MGSVGCDVGRNPLVEELRAGDDRFDHWVEMIAAGRKFLAHAGDDGIVGGEERATQRVREQLAAEILDKLVLHFRAEISLQTRETRALTAVGKYGARLGGPPGKVGGAH